MTFDEFIATNTGHGVDVDGRFGPQCMDLYRAYVRDVLGFPQSPPVAGAVNVWDTYLPEHFERIEYRPPAVPQKGDVVIWSKLVGQFGHIAIFISGDANQFTSFDQNWPVGSRCHPQSHSYRGVLGWLSPRGMPMPPPLPAPDVVTNQDAINALFALAPSLATTGPDLIALLGWQSLYLPTTNRRLAFDDRRLIARPGPTDAQWQAVTAAIRALLAAG